MCLHSDGVRQEAWKYVHNSYGLLRTPWNVNNVPYLTRHNQTNNQVWRGCHSSLQYALCFYFIPVFLCYLKKKIVSRVRGWSCSRCRCKRIRPPYRRHQKKCTSSVVLQKRYSKEGTGMLLTQRSTVGSINSVACHWTTRVKHCIIACMPSILFQKQFTKHLSQH